MQFRYVARTATGETIRGSLLAADVESALAGLRARALFPTRLAPQRLWNRDIALPGLGGGISGRARVAFFRSFATLIRAGVPMRRALTVAIERSDTVALKRALRDVLEEIERGEALSVALARRPRDFPPLIVAMIAAGEAGGILDEVLERIATFLERDDALRKSVISALAYPATVLIASIVLVVFLIVRIVPMFSDLFASFHVDLPPSTVALLWLGNTLGRPMPWLIATACVVLLTVAFERTRRTPRGGLFFDAVRLRLPIVGALLRKTVAARVARMLGTLVHSGVELTRALDVVIAVTGSPVYSSALAHVAAAIRDGEPLAPPMARVKAFDPMMVALVGVGEDTGMLDVMFGKAADYFESDVAAAIATLGAVIEPALILMLGFVVGLIVYSVFIPLYSLIGSVSK